MSIKHACNKCFHIQAHDQFNNFKLLLKLCHVHGTSGIAVSENLKMLHCMANDHVLYCNWYERSHIEVSW